FLGAGRQRWEWVSGNQLGWVEFRPFGVLWHRDDGVGAWELLGDRGGALRIALHLKFRPDRPEVRYVMQLRRPSGNDSAQSLWLDESQREVFRPLGFCSSAPRSWKAQQQQRKVSLRALGDTKSLSSSAAMPRAPSRPPPVPVSGSFAAASTAVAERPPQSPETSSGDARGKLSYLLGAGAAVRESDLAAGGSSSSNNNNNNSSNTSKVGSNIHESINSNQSSNQRHIDSNNNSNSNQQHINNNKNNNSNDNNNTNSSHEANSHMTTGSNQIAEGSTGSDETKATARGKLSYLLK
ncbi:unnamed protein product, partial [Polarella glacialis]